MFKFLRNRAVVICLLFSFASMTIATSVWAIVQTQKATAASAALASKVAQHKKQIFRQNAKSRLKRIAVAIPFAGAAAGWYFEERERKEWLAANPGKTSGDYICEMAAATAEVASEVLAGQPKLIQFFSWDISSCDEEELK